jgi:hypothetical protein
MGVVGVEEVAAIGIIAPTAWTIAIVGTALALLVQGIIRFGYKSAKWV